MDPNGIAPMEKGEYMRTTEEIRQHVEETESDYEPVIRCDVCGDVIEDDPFYWTFDGKNWCEACFREWEEDHRQTL